MIEKREKFQIEADKNLYLLSFIDVIDRIDIFILEIRHLQQSIIYNLHAPSLYLPLRFEEQFVLESNWEKALWDKTDSVWDARLASKYVIRYPSPKVAVSTYQSFKPQKHDKASGKKQQSAEEKSFIQIKKRLRLRVGQIWMGDDWSRDQRRQYYMLRTLQILKQQVVRLKFTLARGAIKADLIGKKEVKRQLEPAAFVILRRGVVVSLRDYVKVFNNHRQQMAHYLEFGLPHDPSPSIERRREIGLFADYMSSSGDQMHADILSLLKCFDLPLDLKNIRPLVFHSWSHSHKVDNFDLYDDVFALQKERHLLSKDGGYGLEDGQNISYINSSFWLPDRPDLYPIAAREVAIGIVREQFYGLDDVVFATYPDKFTDLLLIFKTTLSDWSRKNPELAFIEDSIAHALQTFASDFLAATIKGVSYLYALFLLRLGDNAESQLYLNASVDDKMSFDLSYLLENGTAPFEEDMLWYFQFHLVATWVEKTAHIDLSPLDKIVTQGVRTISDDVLAFLDKHTPPKRMHCATLLTGLKDELVRAINEHDVVSLAQNWRKQRSRDYWDEKTKKPGKGCFPRTSQRLDTRLQNYLYRLLLKQKTGKDRLLIDEKAPLTKKGKPKPLEGKALEKRFRHIYQKLNIDEHTIPQIKGTFRHPKSLFRHVYDIPFQCSVMRSIDLIHKEKTSWKNSWQYIWQQMYQDMAQGRDLFAIALEFHMREVESPRERLMQCINLVTHVLRVFNIENESQQTSMWQEKSVKLEQQLTLWLNNNDLHKMQSMMMALHSNSTKMDLSFVDIRDKCSNSSGVLQMSAATLSAKYFSAESYNALFIRRLEFLSKCKLNELFTHVDSYCKFFEKTQQGHHGAYVEEKSKPRLYKYLVELRHVVALQNNQPSRQDQMAKDEFYRTMLKAFGDRWERDEGQGKKQKNGKKQRKNYPLLPYSLKTSLLSRLVMTNIYPILNSKNISQNPYETPYSEPLDKVLSRSFWLAESPNKNSDHKEVGYTMLGRYDAIVVRKTEWPCRCNVQKVIDDDAIKKNKGIEKFIPYFSRRETALRMNLKSLDAKNTNAHFNKKEVFAIVVVSLQRRPMRLDFLFRLLRDNTGNTESYLDGLDAGLEKCFAARPKNIQVRAYLTDGWGDVVLFFSQNELTIESIDWIHKLQIVLFEDVMVDRIETLFAPTCLDHVIADSRYQVGVQIRLLEDRWLSYSSQRFRDVLMQTLPEELKDKLIVSVFTIPGRKDYRIVFNYKESAPKQILRQFYQQIIKWFATRDDSGKASIMQLIDRIETIIEQKIEKE